MQTDSFFTEIHSDTTCRARTGILNLPHGPVRTPVFMPVGTRATVKAMSKDDLEAIGFEIILANTYHLYLRPGTDILEKAGGLHGFSGWNKNFLTDSGGFQVFSLAPFRKITSEGVTFRSHRDGSRHLLTPESVVDIQRRFNSDIQMQLDVCTGYDIPEKKAREALTVTSGWALRAKDAWQQARDTGYQGALFPIVQGNFYRHLRKESAEFVASLDMPGIAIGGLSVGEPAEVFAGLLVQQDVFFRHPNLPQGDPLAVLVLFPGAYPDIAIDSFSVFHLVSLSGVCVPSAHLGGAFFLSPWAGAPALVVHQLTPKGKKTARPLPQTREPACGAILNFLSRPVWR